MLTFSAAGKIFLAVGAVDMRKSFDGLAAVVRSLLRRDPLSGDTFVFCNRRRTLVKILAWDRSGYWVHAKRLEKGTFAWPGSEAEAIQMAPEEMVLLLAGIELRGARRRRWYHRAATATA